MVDIIALVSISFAGAVSLIHAIQASKCDIINLGCISCHRVVKDDNSESLEQISPRVMDTMNVENLNNI